RAKGEAVMATATQITDDEVLAKFPGVPIDFDNKEHYKGLLQRRLLINRCQKCGYWIYPHRDSCPKCWAGADSVKPTEVSGKGFIYMFSLVHQDGYNARSAGADFSQPFPLVAVELQEREGLRYLSTIVNCRNGDIRI